MRAYGYFYLTQFYANSYNPAAEILPIYTDPIQPNQPKSTTEAVFNLIIEDLTDAVSLLENFTRTQKNQVDKHVASGLLAYTYGAMGGSDNYALAKTLTSNILSNGGFNLMNSNEITGGFNDVNTSGWMWGVDLTLERS